MPSTSTNKINNKINKDLKTIELPKVTLPKKYMTASMPTRGAYHSEETLYQAYHYNYEGYCLNSDENLLLSQPLPDTVKIVNEKPNIGKKDSYWLGW
jgi:hypothetical protein